MPRYAWDCITAMEKVLIQMQNVQSNCSQMYCIKIQNIQLRRLSWRITIFSLNGIHAKQSIYWKRWFNNTTTWRHCVYSVCIICTVTIFQGIQTRQKICSNGSATPQLVLSLSTVHLSGAYTSTNMH